MNTPEQFLNVGARVLLTGESNPSQVGQVLVPTCTNHHLHELSRCVRKARGLWAQTAAHEAPTMPAEPNVGKYR